MRYVRQTDIVSDRIAATFVFAVLYFGGLFVAAELNAAAIIRDAVVGPVTIAIIYAGMFAPSAIAAAGSLLVARATRSARFALAVGFALAIAIFVFAFFVGWESKMFGGLLRKADLPFFAAANVLFIAAFIVIGVLIDRRNLRRHAGETAV